MFKWIICYVFGCKDMAFWCKYEKNRWEYSFVYELLTEYHMKIVVTGTRRDRGQGGKLKN